MSTALADLAFVAAVVAITTVATGGGTPTVAVWFPRPWAPRCDICGSRHDGECPAAIAPVRRVPSWAREENTP